MVNEIVQVQRSEGVAFVQAALCAVLKRSKERAVGASASEDVLVTAESSDGGSEVVVGSDRTKCLTGSSQVRVVW